MFASPSASSFARLLLGALVLGLVGCGETPAPDLGMPDMGPDRGTFLDFGQIDRGVTPECDEDSKIGDICRFDADCNDNCFCNGTEVCNGGLCEAATRALCDDEVDCTVDTCNEETGECTNAINNDFCIDETICNGVERCDATLDCLPGTPLDCSDGDTCTVDNCDPVNGCFYEMRDLDGDGFVSDDCDGTDCDDDPISGPTVNPAAMEICDDGVDNNCDALTDFFDMVACPPTNDTCDTPRLLAGAGTYQFPSFGLEDDYTLICEPAAGVRNDAVFEFELTAVRDVEVEMDVANAAIEIRRLDDCADDAETLVCDNDTGFNDAASVRINSAEIGRYALIISTTTPEAIFSFDLRITVPIMPPDTNECVVGTAPLITSTTAFSGTFVGATDNYDELDCADRAFPEIDVAYRLSLTGPRDVTVTATGEDAMGNPTDIAYSVIEDCDMPNSTEVLCTESDDADANAINLRDLAAGEYWIMVQPDDITPSTGYDLTVDINIPPASPPRGDRCVNPIDITTSRDSVLLNTIGRDFGTTCAPLSPVHRDAFFSFDVDVESDVTITTETATNHFLALSSDCTSLRNELECVMSDISNIATITRRLDPGTYYAIVAVNSSSATADAVVEITPVP